MNTHNKRRFIYGGAAALVLIGTIAQLTTSRAQNAAPATAAASTNAAPAELPKLPADLSPGLSDVIKLVQSNVGDQVVIGYIKNSGKTYQPTADEIVYLNDLGVSQDVINALMQNGNGPAPIAAIAPQGQQIPNPPSSATLTSPEVPTYNVTQDAPLDSTAQVPPPDVPLQAPTTTVVDQTPPPEVSVNYFYDSLSPYGTWVDVEGYGRCWRPTVGVVNGGWRPYCDNGYWVNSDCGWYWQSYYSWGWAPFHYGRWCTSPRFGWFWVPDCTWGPAWVAWREHDRYCGWAPLPPHAIWRPGAGIVWAGGHHGHVDWGFGLSAGAFTFVSYDHFTDHHPWRHQAPHNEVVNIYNHSTVIKNTVVVNNKTIINNGIPKEKIINATHKPIQTYALKDSRSAGTHGRVEHVGNKPALAVYRPSPTTIAKAAKTPAVHNKPVLINHGAPHTSSFGSSSHSAFNSPDRSYGSHSPMTSPKTSSRDWASTSHSTPQVHQAWPGENASRSSIPHSSPAASEKVASANHEHATFEPSPRSSASSKAVEQPNNYFGSGAYHHQSAAPSYAPSHESSGNSGGHANFGGGSYGGGRASFGGGSSGAGHSFGGGGHFDRSDNGGGRNH